MQIQNVPITSVKPYEKNPRFNDDAVDAVARSIKEFGWQQPIVIDSEMVVIAGHTRLKAAERLGLTEVPVIVAENLTPEQVKAYRIADNKSAELAEWNLQLLRDELLARGASQVCCATWFMQVSELTHPNDVRLREEADLAELVATGNFDVLVGDPTLWRMLGGFDGQTVDVPQFAVSGKLGER